MMEWRFTERDGARIALLGLLVGESHGTRHSLLRSYINDYRVPYPNSSIKLVFLDSFAELTAREGTPPFASCSALLEASSRARILVTRAGGNFAGGDFRFFEELSSLIEALIER